MARFSAFLGVVCLVSATACSMAADPVGPARKPVPVPADQRASASATPVAGEVPADMLDKIRADLGSRHGFAATAIKVVSAESVNWPNGALGCAKPGEMVTQAIVPGYRVVLEAGGKQFAYHAAQRGFFRLCENESSGGMDRGSIK